MLMLVALSVMSVTWMSVIAVLVLAQKLLPAKAAIDVPLALAIVGVGICSSSRPRRFADSRHRCETSSVARPRQAVVTTRKERTNDRSQDRNT
jgi:hypothetical protein